MMATRTVAVAAALVVAVITVTLFASVHHSTVTHADAAAAPQAAVPACTSSAQPGAYTNAVWLGADARTHSVQYETSSTAHTTVTSRWCHTPTVLAADGASSALAAIPRGAPVRVITSSTGWVTEVIVERSARSTRRG